MSRINTNVPSLVAARVLAQQTSSLQQSLMRLSTGLKINAGGDDPAGLIASESLRSEARALAAAVENASRAKTVLSTTESALSEVSALLLELEELVDKSANSSSLSPDEVTANQLQIDSILDSINRIANTTQFNGKKLLNGDLAYTTSGVASSNLSRVQIHAAGVPAGAALPVTVSVTQSAQTARLTLAAGGATGLSSSGHLSAANNVTLSIQGALGTQSFSFTGGTVNSAVRNAINAFKAVTGVSASLSGQAIRLNSTAYGSDAFVSVSVSSGAFGVTGGDVSAAHDKGRDAGVRVNGQVAAVKGLSASIRTDGLDLALDLSTSFGTAVGSTTFYVTGGGADFAISTTLTLAGRASLGVGAVTTANLGDAANGYLSSLATGQANDMDSGNYAKAQAIVRAANDQVAAMRGRLGAFEKNTLDTTINSLSVALENVQAADSAIRDTDFAVETSRLTRAQILLQAASQALLLANQAPSQVLSLLR
jgi:flagellin